MGNYPFDMSVEQMLAFEEWRNLKLKADRTLLPGDAHDAGKAWCRFMYLYEMTPAEAAIIQHCFENLDQRRLRSKANVYFNEPYNFLAALLSDRARRDFLNDDDYLRISVAEDG